MCLLIKLNKLVVECDGYVIMCYSCFRIKDLSVLLSRVKLLCKVSFNEYL